MRILFKEKISKSQRLSNWEADVLSDFHQKSNMPLPTHVLPQHIQLIAGTEANGQL